MNRKSAPYTDDEVEKMIAMNKAGSSWPEISKVLGRSSKSLYIKFRTLKSKKLPQRRNQIKVQRRQSKRAVQAETAAVVEAKVLPGRPMIALVGTPSEVTSSIRELFS